MNEDIKKEIHKLVDEINDTEALNILREDAAAYAEKKDIIDDLSPEQLKVLEEAIAEDDRGETITFEEFQRHIAEWKRKLFSQSDF